MVREDSAVSMTDVMTVADNRPAVPNPKGGRLQLEFDFVAGPMRQPSSYERKKREQDFDKGVLLNANHPRNSVIDSVPREMRARQRSLSERLRGLRPECVVGEPISSSSLRDLARSSVRQRLW